MPNSALTAISPLDGRYAGQLEVLRNYFSEFGLIRYRVRVEIEWLVALAAHGQLREIGPFSDATVAELRRLAAEFSTGNGERVKAIEVQAAAASRELELLRAAARMQRACSSAPSFESARAAARARRTPLRST